MKYSGERYSFEIPDRFKDLIGVKRGPRRADIVLLAEDDPACCGILVSLRCRRTRIRRPDDCTELLGTLKRSASSDASVRRPDALPVSGAASDGAADGPARLFVYAVYGREGAVSEMNEDLYWRLRDRLWSVFDSIEAADGYSWEKA